MKLKAIRLLFTFERQPVIAYATMAAGDYDLSFNVRYQSPFIRQFLPEGCIRFSLADSIAGPLYPSPQVEALLISTSEALSKRLQSESLFV